MNTRNAPIHLPTPGNYDFMELPEALQQLLYALEGLDRASAALDSIERGGRLLNLSLDPVDTDEWRWRQQASLDAWRLRERIRARAELAYVTHLIEREREEGRGQRGKLVDLTAARLSLLAHAE